MNQCTWCHKLLVDDIPETEIGIWFHECADGRYGLIVPLTNLIYNLIRLTHAKESR